MSSEEKKASGPVLVAIDFSADSAAALAWAVRYTERDRRRLVLLQVVHDPAAHPGFYRDAEQDQLQPMETVAREMMDEFLRRQLHELRPSKFLERADRLFVAGLPAARIVEVAELLDADVVVVGSRGRTGLPHLLLGSVAERVVELAQCPVVVVKSRQPDEAEVTNAGQTAEEREKDRKRLEQMLESEAKPGANDRTDD